MPHLLWLVPALPLAGFLLLALFGARLSRGSAALLGVGSVGAAATVALLILAAFLSAPPAGGSFTQPLWTWMNVDGFHPEFRLLVDPVSLLTVLVVTGVGFLIHLYSAAHMRDEPGYSRFFAYMNLFVAAMLVLVLADNLLVLYLGWEGVGLCSYLLIGFWYQDPANGRAARKAFIVTRVGDTAFALGLFLLFHSLGTLNIQQAMLRATALWPVGSREATLAAALLLVGAMGKSAQVPLHTWLPDAMAGPTPTSALIHAATMVTAGVYLIARLHVLFSLAPAVQAAVAAIGVATMLMASFSALVQRDIKRILAYSTISQIGYMFLALGVGAWSAAMYHLMTHAFFKALLFLAAGVVIQATHHEHDIFRMGGLRRELPTAFWSFVIGGSALAGLPLVTAGFYSKDLILWQSWTARGGSPALWACAVAGALLTALYTFRLVFVVFYGRPGTHVSARPRDAENVALVVLCTLSIVGGAVNTPPDFGGVPFLSNWLQQVLPASPAVHGGAITEGRTGVVAALSFLCGFGAAWFLYLRRRSSLMAWRPQGAARMLQALWFSNWGFDLLYDRLFVRPVDALARLSRADALDAPFRDLALGALRLHHALSRTQTGRLQWYVSAMMAGTVVFAAVALFL